MCFIFIILMLKIKKEYFKVFSIKKYFYKNYRIIKYMLSI